MDDPSSDDYELMPRQELEDLRRELSALKKNSMTDGDKARVLIESMDRLTISINRLVTILDDAQKDIIDEYQQSKPAEKLNQLLEQNEMIAKAIVAISDNLQGSGSISMPSPKNNTSSSNSSSSFNSNQGYSGMPSMPSQNGPMSNPRNIMSPSQSQGSMNSSMSPPMPPMGSMNMGPMNNMNMSSQMSPMDDLPPMDAMPPLDGQPGATKKKFLGIM